MTLVENKKARMRFSVLETFQAGIELTGAEVKSLRSKQGSLEGARVIVRGGEAFLTGMSLPPYQPSNASAAYEADRSRKLLMQKKEIAALADAESKKGLTVVPLELYTHNRLIKVRVAIVRGKTDVDRREDLKRQDAKREIDRALRSK